jgi:TPR repeat protein
MPEIITFLPDQNAFLLPDEYLQPPLQKLMKSLHSRPERGDVYRAVFNGNPDFKVEDYRRALEKKAAQGDPEAKYALALVYYYGMIDAEGKSGRAYSKAFELLSELQDLPGEIGAHANALIGEMYFNGTVPQEGQSFITAREHHKKAAEYSAFSAREYAYICSRGCGDSMDTDEITQYYEKVIEVGDKIAVLGLAQYYKEHGRFREAAALYEKSKEQIPEAEMELGVIYAKGLHKDPPEPDYFRAASLLHHAIGRENCDPRAYYELGVLYLMPYGGFIKDEKKAQELFAEAAARGVANAAFKLGCMFEYGTVEKNTETAIEYFTMASEAGRPLAAYHLALLYQQPEVCNYHKAFRYAKIAAERGVPEGEYVYGSMLLFGRGCKADRDAAIRHLRSAYKHGVFQAKMLIDAQKNAPASLPSSERD